MNDAERLLKLEQELTDIQSRLPKHSVPAAMILELEALEDAIDQLRRQIHADSSTSEPQTQLAQSQ